MVRNKNYVKPYDAITSIHSFFFAFIIDSLNFAKLQHFITSLFGSDFNNFLKIKIKPA